MSKITVVWLPANNAQNPVERVLSSVGGSDLELADELHHGDEIRPYATAPAPGGIDVITFDDRIASALLRGNDGAKLVTRVDLECVRCWEPNARVIRMAFETPTHFRAAGLEYQIPDPFHVFGNLMERWNALGWPPLKYPNIKRIGITFERLSRRKMPTLNSHPQYGFVGVVRYDIVGLSDIDQAATWSLARFGEYRGVGKHTSYGMGRIRLLSPDEQWRYGERVGAWRDA